MVSHTTRLVCYAIPLCPGPSHPDTKVPAKRARPIRREFTGPLFAVSCRVRPSVAARGAAQALHRGPAASLVALCCFRRITYGGFLLLPQHPRSSQRRRGNATRPPGLGDSQRDLAVRDALGGAGRGYLVRGGGREQGAECRKLAPGGKASPAPKAPALVVCGAEGAPLPPFAAHGEGLRPHH
eukprot:scaffold13666_cov49-Phaeocystis_antarctica.AAC.2